MAYLKKMPHIIRLSIVAPYRMNCLVLKKKMKFNFLKTSRFSDKDALQNDLNVMGMV